MVNLARSRQSAHNLIQRWSGGKPSYLVRNGVKRAATMALREYNVRERSMFVDKSVSICISVIPADPAPDYELDVIEFAGKTYKILQPPGGPRSDGEPIYHDCNCVQT